MSNATIHVSARDLAAGDIFQYLGVACTVVNVATHSTSTAVRFDMNGKQVVEVVPATASVHIIRTTEEA